MFHNNFVGLSRTSRLHPAVHSQQFWRAAVFSPLPWRVTCSKGALLTAHLTFSNCYLSPRAPPSCQFIHLFERLYGSYHGLKLLLPVLSERFHRSSLQGVGISFTFTSVKYDLGKHCASCILENVHQT